MQDRFVKEIRLAGISSIEDANAFLDGFIKRYNKRLSVPAADPNAVWVQVGSDFDADYYFSLRESSVVRSDHTISWFVSTIQVRRGYKDASLAGKRVNMHTTPEGKCVIYHGKPRIKHRIIKERPGPFANVPELKQMIDVNAPESHQNANVRKRGWLFGKTPAEAA